MASYRTNMYPLVSRFADVATRAGENAESDRGRSPMPIGGKIGGSKAVLHGAQKALSDAGYFVKGYNDLALSTKDVGADYGKMANYMRTNATGVRGGGGEHLTRWIGRGLSPVFLNKMLDEGSLRNTTNVGNAARAFNEWVAQNPEAQHHAINTLTKHGTNYGSTEGKVLTGYTKEALGDNIGNQAFIDYQASGAAEMKAAKETILGDFAHTLDVKYGSNLSASQKSNLISNVAAKMGISTSVLNGQSSAPNPAYNIKAHEAWMASTNKGGNTFGPGSPLAQQVAQNSVNNRTSVGQMQPGSSSSAPSGIHPNLTALQGDSNFTSSFSNQFSRMSSGHQGIVSNFLNGVTSNYNQTYALNQAKAQLDGQVSQRSSPLDFANDGRTDPSTPRLGAMSTYTGSNGVTQQNSANSYVSPYQSHAMGQTQAGASPQSWFNADPVPRGTDRAAASGSGSLAEQGMYNIRTFTNSNGVTQQWANDGGSISPTQSAALGQTQPGASPQSWFSAQPITQSTGTGAPTAGDPSLAGTGGLAAAGAAAGAGAMSSGAAGGAGMGAAAMAASAGAAGAGGAAGGGGGGGAGGGGGGGEQ